MESSVGVQSGWLKLEHICDKESIIVVQHKVNNVILTQKEKRELRDKKYRSTKKNLEEDKEKERQRRRNFYDKYNNSETIKRNFRQLYDNIPKPKKQKMNK